jgi:hypothetical protein
MYCALRAEPVGSVGRSEGGRSGSRADGRGTAAESEADTGNVDRIGVGAASDDNVSEARGMGVGGATAAFLTAL